MMVNGYLKQLNTSFENQTKLMEQSDGSKLHRPSDDAIGYSKFLRYHNSKIENEQYTTNVRTASSWMKNTDASLVDICGCLSTVVEKTNAAANDTNSETDFQAIAKEMMAMIQQSVSDANVQVDGHYLIAGQKDLIQPFILGTEKKDMVDRGLSKTLDDNQKAFFESVSSEDDYLKTSTSGAIAQMLTLEGSDGETYYLNTRNGYIYTKEFIDQGYKRNVAEGFTTVREGDEIGKLDPNVVQGNNVFPKDFVKNNFDNRGVIEKNVPGQGTQWNPNLTDKDGNVLQDKDGNDITLKFSTVNQFVVTYAGDDKYISMVKQNGTTDPSADTVNVTGLDICASDIFDNEFSGNTQSGTAAFNNVLTIVKMTENCDTHWLDADGIALANNSYNVVLESESKLAARQQVYSAVDEMLGKQSATITGDISAVADTDVAQLAVALMTAQTIYNLSLSVGGRILPGSLADYLR